MIINFGFGVQLQAQTCFHKKPSQRKMFSSFCCKQWPTQFLCVFSSLSYPSGKASLHQTQFILFFIIFFNNLANTFNLANTVKSNCHFS